MDNTQTEHPAVLRKQLESCNIELLEKEDELKSINIEASKLKKKLEEHQERVSYLQDRKNVLTKKVEECKILEIAQQKEAISKATAQIKGYMIDTYRRMATCGTSFFAQNKKLIEESLYSCVSSLNKENAEDCRKEMYEKHLNNKTVEEMESVPEDMKKATAEIALSLSDYKLEPIAKNVKITVFNPSGNLVHTYTSTKGEPIIIGRIFKNNDINTDVTDKLFTGISRINCLVLPLWDLLNKRVVFFVMDFWSILGTRVLGNDSKEIGVSKATTKGDGRTLMIVSGTNFFVQVGGINITTDSENKGVCYKFVTEILKE